MWNKVKRFLYDEQGITSVEIILILVVLIGLVLIFKEEMTEIVNNIFKTIRARVAKFSNEDDEKRFCNNHAGIVYADVFNILSNLGGRCQSILPSCKSRTGNGTGCIFGAFGISAGAV